MRMLKGCIIACLQLLCLIAPNLANARFNSVDPLQGKYPAWSPYVYAQANPFKNVDPDGRATVRYDVSGFLSTREKYLGWAPNWVKEFIAPVDPVIDPSAMAVAGGRNLAKGAIKAVGEATEVADDFATSLRPGRLGGPEHRAKVAERTSELQAQGHKIEGGGGQKPELAVKDPNTGKVVRYPDITTTDPVGETHYENVGKTNKRGDPVKRERDALNDIENTTGSKPGFTPYDREITPEP